MNILIKNAEMPTSCWDCEVGGAKQMDNATCPFYSMEHWEQVNYQDKIADGCPIIPVPPHGRTIDADALIKDFKTKAKNPLNQETTPYSWAFAYECLADVVGDMPTIIPAEESEI